MSATPANTATEVKVWDPLVRIFHWSLVIAFATAYLTGDEESAVHEWAGYVVLGLIAFRVLWGFIGTRHARFTDFVDRPGNVLRYARDFFSGRARRYLGHNPLGGMMVLALLISLAVTGLTGWQMTRSAPAGPTATLHGPAPTTLAALLPIAPAHADDDDDKHEGNGGGEALEEVHEFFANLTVLLVILHITGAIAGGLLHRENLVRAMFTGRKSV